MIASYTIIDGLGARRSGRALSYIAWMNICESTALLAAGALVSRRPPLGAPCAAISLARSLPA
mgnify:CR=1 FL=1